jgi:hypothetical protein
MADEFQERSLYIGGSKGLEIGLLKGTADHDTIILLEIIISWFSYYDMLKLGWGKNQFLIRSREQVEHEKGKRKGGPTYSS